MIWAIVGRSYGFCGNRIEFGINWYADWRASIPFQRRRPTLKHGQGGGLKLAPNSQLVDPELKPLANWAGWQLVDLPPQLTSWMNRCGDCLMGRVWTWYWLLGYPPRRVGPGYMLSQWEHGLQVPKRGGVHVSTAKAANGMGSTPTTGGRRVTEPPPWARTDKGR